MNAEPIMIRASSLAALFECPARWEAQHIRKLRMPASASARLGTAVHASTALFDASRLMGTGLTADEAAGAAVDAIHKPDEDVLWDELQPSEAEKIAISLHRLYCGAIAPRQIYAAVEATCERLEFSDLGIALTGTVDRVRRTEDGYGIVDIKTGKSAVCAERKRYKRLIEEQEKIAQSAAKLYRDGKAEREVHCDLIKDWDKCEMVWIEAEPPYREVLRRPMTAEERQGSFLEKPLAAPAADDVIDVDAEEQ